MVPHVRRSALSLLAVAAVVAWLAPAAQAQEPHPIVLLAKKLAEPVDFPGIDDPAMTLQEALEMLAKRYSLQFDVNEKAFHNEAGPGAAAQAPRSGSDDVFFVVAGDKPVPPGKPGPGARPDPAGKPAPGDKPSTPGKAAPPGKSAPPVPQAARAPAEGVLGCLVATRPIPKMSQVRLETVLKKILARVPSASGATYVLRRDGIEITTAEFKLAEFRTANASLPPGLDAPPPPIGMPMPELFLVQADFDKRPLDQAFKELANATDSTIVLDGRAADKAKPVTAALINVPLDTAVEILANMSGLQVVSRDRVLYVTTRDNADAMRKEMQDRVGGMPNSIPSQPGGPGLMPFGPGQPGGLGPIPFGPGQPGGLGPIPMGPGQSSAPGAPRPGAEKGPS